MTNNVRARVDFQSQLETNLGRNRKRKRKEHFLGKGKKGSKLKKEEKEYKPKMGMNLVDEDAKGSSTDKLRRTRRKPPSTKERSC